MQRVPILKLGSILIASLQSELTDREFIAFEEDLLERVGEHGSTGVVVDLSAADVLDSFATRTLRDIAAAVRLRGARAVVVGIQPEVARAMVGLGLRLEGVPTALDLEGGLAILGHAPQ